MSLGTGPPLPPTPRKLGAVPWRRAGCLILRRTSHEQVRSFRSVGSPSPRPAGGRRSASSPRRHLHMRAVRVHRYHEDPQVDEIDGPTLAGPLDVIVRIGGAGVCRTDLHIIEGQWDALQHPDLPYV